MRASAPTTDAAIERDEDGDIINPLGEGALRSHLPGQRLSSETTAPSPSLPSCRSSKTASSHHHIDMATRAIERDGRFHIDREVISTIQRPIGQQLELAIRWDEGELLVDLESTVRLS